MKRSKVRMVRVQTVIPSEYVKEIMSSSAIQSRDNRIALIGKIDNSSLDIRKNSDDNTALIQKDIARVEILLERVLCVSIVSILLSCIILICC